MAIPGWEGSLWPQHDLHQIFDKRELGRAESKMLEFLLEKMGMDPRQRKSVLAGGPERARLLAQVDSAQRERASQAQTAVRTQSQSVLQGNSSEPVTLPVTAPLSDNDEPLHEQLYNYLMENDFESETGGSNEEPADVTQGVTPEGA